MLFTKIKRIIMYAGIFAMSSFFLFGCGNSGKMTESEYQEYLEEKNAKSLDEWESENLRKEIEESEQKIEEYQKERDDLNRRIKEYESNN